MAHIVQQGRQKKYYFALAFLATRMSALGHKRAITVRGISRCKIYVKLQFWIEGGVVGRGRLLKSTLRTAFSYEAEEKIVGRDALNAKIGSILEEAPIRV